jgi:hypothetical protein
VEILSERREIDTFKGVIRPACMDKEGVALRLRPSAHVDGPVVAREALVAGDLGHGIDAEARTAIRSGP